MDFKIMFVISVLVAVMLSVQGTTHIPPHTVTPTQRHSIKPTKSIVDVPHTVTPTQRHTTNKPTTKRGHHTTNKPTTKRGHHTTNKPTAKRGHYPFKTTTEIIYERSERRWRFPFKPKSIGWHYPFQPTSGFIYNRGRGRTGGCSFKSFEAIIRRIFLLDHDIMEEKPSLTAEERNGIIDNRLYGGGYNPFQPTSEFIYNRGRGRTGGCSFKSFAAIVRRIFLLYNDVMEEKPSLTAEERNGIIDNRLDVFDLGEYPTKPEEK